MHHTNVSNARLHVGANQHQNSPERVKKFTAPPPGRVTGRDKRLLAKPQLLQPSSELILRYQVVDSDAEPAGEDEQYDDYDLLDRVNIEIPDFDGGLDGKDHAYNPNNKSYHSNKN